MVIEAGNIAAHRANILADQAVYSLSSESKVKIGLSKLYWIEEEIQEFCPFKDTSDLFRIP
jgi:hypothetical protein